MQKIGFHLLASVGYHLHVLLMEYQYESIIAFTYGFI